MARVVHVVVCAAAVAVLGGCSLSSDGPGAASLAQRIHDGDAPAGIVAADAVGRRHRDAEELAAMLLTEQDFDRHTAALAPEAGYLVDDPIVLCDGAELGELAGDVPTAATGFGKYDELSVLGTGTPHGNPDGEWFTQRIWRFGSDAAAADFVTAAEAAFACGSWTADPTRPDLSSNVLAAAPAAGLGDGGFAVVKARGPIVTTYEVVRLGPVVTLVTDSLVVAEGRVPSGDELLGDEVRVGLACTASRRIADAGRPIVGHDVEMSACDPSPTTSAPAGPTTAESTTSAAPPASLAP